MIFINFLVYLMAHCLADTSFQTDRMASGKSRHNPINPAHVPKGQKPLVLWWHWLTHHAVIHGAMALLATYFLTENKELAITIGLIEVIAHWTIDFFKCESKYNPHVDQILHLSCKLIYSIII